VIPRIAQPQTSLVRMAVSYISGAKLLLKILCFGYHKYGDVMIYYYGGKKSESYFEGWYFKCQSMEGKCLGLIPAIHIDSQGCRSASIQVITEERSWWIPYLETAFSAQRKKLYIQLGNNVFSETGIRLDIHDDGIDLEGTIIFDPFTRLKYPIMGPFHAMPNMECAHGVISMKHTLTGQLRLNGVCCDFDNGIGYIESDRGSSFPSSYLWAQDVWEEGSFMLSIAEIPIGRINFTGCICAVLLDGKEHRIATYLGGKVKHWSSHGAAVQQGRYMLKVEVLNQKGHSLMAPSTGEMTRTIRESVCTKMQIRLSHGKKVLLERVTDCAGFEYTDCQ